MNIKNILIVAGLCLPLPSMAAGNAEAGAKKAETCKACHGEAGRSEEHTSELQSPC